MEDSSAVPTQLIDLHEIQQLDVQVREEERSVKTLYATLEGLEAGLSKLAIARDSLDKQIEQTDAEAHALHQSVEADRDKIRKWEARLGDIRNQREYQALQRETEGARRANRDAETKLTELWAQKEKFEAELLELDEKTDEGTVAQAGERKRVKKAAHEVQERIDVLKMRRDRLVPKVKATIFSRYDAIRGRRQGIGLALVMRGSCTGCNMRLPPQLYNILQRGDTIEQCPSCTRLMLWEQHLKTTSTPQVSAKAEATQAAST